MGVWTLRQMARSQLRSHGAQDLTSGTAFVTTMISSVKWLRGFTYMAQGFTTAGKVLSQGGQADALGGFSSSLAEDIP